MNELTDRTHTRIFSFIVLDKIETTPPTTPHCLQTIAQKELLNLTKIATPNIEASFPYFILYNII